MKKTIALVVVAIMTMGCAVAQQPAQQEHHHHGQNGQHCGRHQHGPKQQAPAAVQYNADGIQMDIVAAFPEVKSIKKVAKWTEVYDAQEKLLGYAVYSKPASDGIKGFNGETPVMIALSVKKKIIGVYALPDMETPKFEQRVKDAGFYDNWNGLTIKAAKKKKVDTVSGATFTSRAVAQSVQAALEKL